MSNIYLFLIKVFKEIVIYNNNVKKKKCVE